jgi:hypothetical protein
MAWAPDYCTPDELRDYLEFNGVGNSDELSLSWAIAAASGAVDKATNRQFGLVDAPESRVYDAQWDRGTGRWFVLIDDLMTVVGLQVATDPLTDETFSGLVGEFYGLMPRNAAQRGVPWTRLDIRSGSASTPAAPERAVQVTARWGWSDVPAAIVQATVLQAARLLARRGAPFGVAGSPDAGSEVRLLAKLDPDVLTTVRPYQRLWVVR